MIYRSDRKMNSFYAFCYATAGWLTAQALPLIFAPRLIAALLSVDVQFAATPLEAYFARSLGFTLIPFAILFLFLTGAFPLGNDISTVDITDVKASPYTTPTLLLTTLYHGSVGFYTYSRYINRSTSQFSYLMATIISGSLAAMGVWCIMFGGDAGHISRRTGADKRTGNWPFGNKIAAKKNVPKSRTRGGMRSDDIDLKEL